MFNYFVISKLRALFSRSIEDQLYAIKLRKSILIHAHGVMCEIFSRCDHIMNHVLMYYFFASDVYSLV